MRERLRVLGYILKSSEEDLRAKSPYGPLVCLLRASDRFTHQASARLTLFGANFGFLDLPHRLVGAPSSSSAWLIGRQLANERRVDDPSARRDCQRRTRFRFTQQQSARRRSPSGLLKTESRRGYRLLGDWTVRHDNAAKPPVGLRQIRATGDSPATNFPAAITPLIGRSAAQHRLQDLVSAYRVVTLTGPGGIGKTMLALEIARSVLGEFADGGWLVELASLSDPDLVPSAVAGTLRLTLGASIISPEAVARAIAEKKLLLVLDNCEHLIDAAATLAETLIRLCPRVTILATSREVLRSEGEYVYRVPPLEVPTEEQVNADQIVGHSAPTLFIARA